MAEDKKIQKTNYFSWKKGGLSKGCTLCVDGRKSVLFITGICPSNCYYCPISDKKKNVDVIYINEKPVEINSDAINEIIKEIELCGSKGVGITGGDPLAKIERTVEYIKALKKKFGKEFHIHLYTPLHLVSEKNLKELYEAGLDEIRFHPNLEDITPLDMIKLAKKYPWDIGVEIPVVPGKEKETKELLDSIENDIRFLNLNELEIADNKFSMLLELGYVAKDNMSYAVEGSEEMALNLLEYCKNKKFKVHYCTATLKDKVQMAKRIMLRAKNIATAFDTVTKEGMIRRGSIYLPELTPEAGYRNKLSALNDKENRERKNTIIERLNTAKEKLSKANIKAEIDLIKLRLICSERAASDQRNKIKSLGFVPAIVEEYPTYDAFEVEIDFL